MNTYVIALDPKSNCIKSKI